MDARVSLAGIRVADFSWVGVGPNATQLLAFLGADVIRVESATRPDVFRNSGPYVPGERTLDGSAYFANYNRDKRSLALNLRHPRAIEVAMRLVAASDVVAESFTPGFLNGIGLGYEAVRDIRPDVIMVSMSMEGQDGPHARFKGFGLTLQATAGITNLTGWPDRPPVGTGVAYTDWFATHVASFAIMAALDYRRRTGIGQYIDLSQLEAVAGLALDDAFAEFALTGRSAQRQGNAHPRMAPHGVYPVAGSDRWIAIACEDDEQWCALAKVLGIPECATDVRLATMAGRLAATDVLDELLENATADRAGEALAEALQAVGVAAHIVATSRDVEEDGQLAHRGQFWKVGHPVIGPLTYDSPGFQLEGSPLRAGRPAPLLGEQTAEVLMGTLGYSEEECAELIASGAIE